MEPQLDVTGRVRHKGGMSNNLSSLSDIPVIGVVFFVFSVLFWLLSVVYWLVDFPRRQFGAPAELRFRKDSFHYRYRSDEWTSVPVEGARWSFHYGRTFEFSKRTDDGLLNESRYRLSKEDATAVRSFVETNWPDKPTFTDAEFEQSLHVLSPKDRERAREMRRQGKI